MHESALKCALLIPSPITVSCTCALRGLSGARDESWSALSSTATEKQTPNQLLRGLFTDDLASVARSIQSEDTVLKRRFAIESHKLSGTWVASIGTSGGVVFGEYFKWLYDVLEQRSSTIRPASLLH